jgi:DNA-binding MarR family transcriptional regulator
MSTSGNSPAGPSGQDGAGTTMELLMAGGEVSRALDRMVRRRAELNLAQFNALRVMASREPDPAQPSDLTRILRMSSAHATAVVHQLAERGLVERAPSPGDQRLRLIRVTTRGRKALAAALPALAQLDERLSEALGSQEASAALWGQLRAVRLALREVLAADDLDRVVP